MSPPPHPAQRMAAGPTAVTIGSFDGVHIGHAALVRVARDAVGPGGRVVALVFDPHPLSVLRPGSEPAPLSTFEQRCGWLAAAGANVVERLEPTPERLAMSPEGFIDWVVERFGPVSIVEGPDFRFGRERAGDAGLLAALGRSRGFGVSIVEPVEATLEDHTIVPARSTVARWLVRHGRVRDAARLLGRPYQIAGVVRRGDRRGRTIGYPTANIDAPHLLPADGVYAGVALLPGGRSVPAAVSVGTKPTFNGQGRALEAHLLDLRAPDAPWAPIDGLDEYGWPIRLDFTAFLRDQARFSGLPALLEQMDRDCRRVRELADGPAVAGSAA
ncbi:MAG: bifunctional riboflavin kinase/FAD synthetase [Phycisphaerae bacterium]|nr:bifunctional riboflavin kinase/FAD synthetase [Phycisphaerae bacterium]